MTQRANNHSDSTYSQAVQTVDRGNLTQDKREQVFKELFETQQSSGAGFGKYTNDFNRDPKRMANLGLPNVELVGFGQDHSVIGKNANDHRLHSYDPRTAADKGVLAMNKETIESGSRTFDRNPDGSLTYKVRPVAGHQGRDRDFYENILRDGLAAQTGVAPDKVSAKDIYNYMAQVKAVNPKIDFNRIVPGQEIKMPPHAAAGDFNPSLVGKKTPITGDLTPNLSNPRFTGFSTSDTNTDGQTNENTRDAKQVAYVARFDGYKEVTTEGRLKDTSFGSLTGSGTEFKRTEITGPDGKLRERNMTYGGDGISLQLQGQKPSSIDGVTKMNIKWDGHQGDYKGTIETKDGKFFTVKMNDKGQLVEITDKCKA